VVVEVVLVDIFLGQHLYLQDHIVSQLVVEVLEVLQLDRKPLMEVLHLFIVLLLVVVVVVQV
jgi:hypothetical protein